MLVEGSVCVCDGGHDDENGGGGFLKAVGVLLNAKKTKSISDFERKSTNNGCKTIEK